MYKDTGFGSQWLQSLTLVQEDQGTSNENYHKGYFFIIEPIGDVSKNTIDVQVLVATLSKTLLALKKMVLLQSHNVRRPIM